MTAMRKLLEEPLRLSQILPQVLKAMELETAIRRREIRKIWKEVVGENISKRCQPQKIKDGVLFLKVHSSVWMNQLHYLKEEMIKSLNARLGGEIVKDIYFRLGEIEEKSTQASAQMEWLDLPLDPEVEKRIEEDLRIIKDPKLKEILGRIRIKDAKVKKINRGR